jgi:hypothetical protein
MIAYSPCSTLFLNETGLPIDHRSSRPSGGKNPGGPRIAAGSERETDDLTMQLKTIS